MRCAWTREQVVSAGVCSSLISLSPPSLRLVLPALHSLITFILRAMRPRNSGKSMMPLPSASTSLTMSCVVRARWWRRKTGVSGAGWFFFCLSPGSRPEEGRPIGRARCLSCLPSTPLSIFFFRAPAAAARLFFCLHPTQAAEPASKGARRGAGVTKQGAHAAVRGKHTARCG